jgi:hypothetical protein
LSCPGAAIVAFATDISFLPPGGPTIRITAAPSTAPTFARPSYDTVAYQSIR